MSENNNYSLSEFEKAKLEFQKQHLINLKKAEDKKRMTMEAFNKKIHNIKKYVNERKDPQK